MPRAVDTTANAVDFDGSSTDSGGSSDNCGSVDGSGLIDSCDGFLLLGVVHLDDTTGNHHLRRYTHFACAKLCHLVEIRARVVYAKLPILLIYTPALRVPSYVTLFCMRCFSCLITQNSMRIGLVRSVM